MKTAKLIGLLTASAFFQTALAVDLDNDDSRRYEVKIYSGASTLNSSIESKSKQLQVCSSCEIEVVGVGRVKVSGSVTVLIKDGKLSVRQ